MRRNGEEEEEKNDGDEGMEKEGRRRERRIALGEREE